MPLALRVTGPVKATPPGAVTVNVVPLIEAVFMAVLKVAVIAALTRTLVANGRGVTDTVGTIGGVAATVVKVHT
jgi:hypothetical protein